MSPLATILKTLVNIPCGVLVVCVNWREQGECLMLHYMSWSGNKLSYLQYNILISENVCDYCFAQDTANKGAKMGKTKLSKQMSLFKAEWGCVSRTSSIITHLVHSLIVHPLKLSPRRTRKHILTKITKWINNSE